MLGNLSPDQFGSTARSANDSRQSTNGQSSSSASSSGTTTVISVKGSAPSISTRST